MYGNGAAPNFVVAPDSDCVLNYLDLNIVNNDIACYEMCPEYLLDGSNISVDFSGRAAGDIRLAATDTALIDQGRRTPCRSRISRGTRSRWTGTGLECRAGHRGGRVQPGNIAGPATMTVSASGSITTASGTATVTVTLDKPAKRDLVLYLRHERHRLS